MTSKQRQITPKELATDSVPILLIVVAILVYVFDISAKSPVLTASLMTGVEEFGKNNGYELFFDGEKKFWRPQLITSFASAREHSITALTAAPPHQTSGAEEGSHRGILISDSIGGLYGQNCIWKWEEGGGPITIGRTVRMRSSGAGVKELVYLVRGDKGRALQVEGEQGGGEQVGGEQGGPVMIILEGGTRKMIASAELSGKKGTLSNMPAELVFDGGRASALSSGGVVFTEGGRVQIIEPDMAGGGNVVTSIVTDANNPKAVGVSATGIGEIGCDGRGSGKVLCDFDRIYFTDDSGLWVLDADTGESVVDDDDEEKDENICRARPPNKQLIYSLGESEPKFNTIKVDRDGNVWLASAGGVVIIDKLGQKIGAFKIKNKGVVEELTGLAIGQDAGSVFVSTELSVFRIRLEGSNVGEIVVPHAASASSLFSKTCKEKVTEEKRKE